MLYQDINKKWYDKSQVQDIIVPTVITWRARYDRKERLKLYNGIERVRSMRAYDMIPTIRTGASYHEIQGFEKYRPDILANRFYGDPKLYWVILAANGMKSPFEFLDGIDIIIPAMSDLLSNGGVLNR